MNIIRVSGVYLIGDDVARFNALKAALNNYCKRSDNKIKYNNQMVVSMLMSYGFEKALSMYADSMF